MPSTMTSTGLAALFSGEPWHYIGAAGEPAFASGWANAGGGTSKCAFRFREGGAVDIYVGASIGTGTSPFTVPEGYRDRPSMVETENRLMRSSPSRRT